MSEPRHINTSGSHAAGSRKINRSGSGRSASAASGRSTQASGSSARSGASAAGGARSSSSAQRGASGTSYSAYSARSAGTRGSFAADTARRPAKKRKKRVAVWVPLVVVLCIVGGAAGVVLGYVNTVLNAIKPDESAATIAQEVKTAPEYSGDVVGVLVCGIDYESTRSYGQNEQGYNDGMTDMIMYFQFDIKNNKVNMLQVPRNTLVGTSYTCADGKTYSASNGQINSIMKSNDDGIAALADVFYNFYQLPVDYYATIDMDALKELVDGFQGIDVYVPQDLSYGGSKLTKGVHTLNGAQVEFLVRLRHAYADGDISRLNMQRYFYAALFKRVRTANLAELFKLVPHVIEYIHTDMPVNTIIALANKFLSVDSANIMVCQTPMYSGDLYPAGGENNSVLVADRSDIADLLNTYFRAYTGTVDASALGIFDDWSHGSSATSANVQYMGQLDTQADDATSAGLNDTYTYSASKQAAGG